MRISDWSSDVCSSDLRESVYRYNHSNEYVDLVLSIMKAYQQGDFTSVPNNTTSASYIPPTYNFTRPTNGAMIGAPGKVKPPKNSSSNPGRGNDSTPRSRDPGSPDPGTSGPGTTDPGTPRVPGRADPSSEERRVGKAWFSTGRYRGSPYHTKKKQ